MKKFVIIALIFALAAGAAFAQDGAWSVSGKGEVGTMLNFAGAKVEKSEIQLDEDTILLKDNAKLHALIGANGYHNIEYYGFIGAELSLAYQIGGLSTGLHFQPKKSGVTTEAYVSYNDGNFAFEYKSDVAAMVVDRDFVPQRLWGYYKFMDGMIHLEAAAKSRDTNFWYSSGVITKYDFGVVANVFGNTHASSAQVLTVAGDSENGYFDLHYGRGFADPDKHNYLLVDVKPIDGLNFGVMVPGVFNFPGAASGGGQGGQTQANGVSNGNAGGWGTVYINGQRSGTHINFLDEALLRSRLGVKYSSGPIEFAAQFALMGRTDKYEVKPELDATGNPVVRTVYGTNGTQKDITLQKRVLAKNEETVNGQDFDETVKTIGTGLYLGGKYQVSDSIGVGIGFQGEFWEPKKPKLGFAAELGFSSGPFTAGLGAGFYTAVDPNESIYLKKKSGPAASPVTIGIENKQFSGMSTIVDDDEDIGNYQVKKATTSYIGVQPVINYALVENFLMLSLDTNLYWRLGVRNNSYERKYQEQVFGYEITPVLWFNVAGTGAAKGWYSGNNTAIMIRYKVAGWIDGSEVRALKKTWQPSQDVNTGSGGGYGKVYTRPIYNAVDVTFKWSF